jgi:hypothetical protein
VEDDPPPRALPGSTADGKQAYPEQTLTADEMETGVKEQDLSETIAKGIRKTKVVVEEPKDTSNTDEELELADPMVLQTEETYLEAFDLDNTHSDAAMRGAPDDWLQLDAEKQKKHDKTKYVAERVHKYVKMKKEASYVRKCRSDALNSIQDYKKEVAKRDNRKMMPRTPPPQEEEEEEARHAAVVARSRNHGGTRPT